MAVGVVGRVSRQVVGREGAGQHGRPGLRGQRQAGKKQSNRQKQAGKQEAGGGLEPIMTMLSRGSAMA
ncbi:hypothetical protein VTK73DRAFT_5907 [Phialemonium thermophilum]|uniref:Uncharacterized protein n=1 Tax=Phialemonium thermophilum TaxID=223376 RepID=A0ABR3V0C4_9PEZI